MNLNKAELIGNLVGDPVAKKLPSGQSVVRFRLATTTAMKDARTKAVHQKPEYHQILAFGKLADVSARYLKKGDRVYVDGRLTSSNWQDKSGVKHQKTEIVLNNLIMLGSKKRNADSEKTNDDVIAEAKNGEG